ncbi:hypothetical protein [Streptomyces sp. NPDC058872]|uniref:hypothetical protein n=1 Tax=Streptomyces sp. NPDC058872 TaxID=3346661 RepID=UPI00368D8E4E
MHDSTHLTQPDEALRLARNGALRLGVLQLALADRLDAEHADHPMTQKLAEAQALRVTEATYGEGTYSDHVEKALIDSLPLILPGETRDTYAARLRLEATGVVA